jgi:hypothetical protein
MSKHAPSVILTSQLVIGGMRLTEIGGFISALHLVEGEKAVDHLIRIHRLADIKRELQEIGEAVERWEAATATEAQP